MYEAVGDDDEVFNNAMEEDSAFMDGFFFGVSEMYLEMLRLNASIMKGSTTID